MLILKNQPLKKYTSFKIGGKAKVLAVPASPQELQELLKKNKLTFFILGGGSNVLVSDKGFDGLVILTTKLDSISIKENCAIVGAGTRLSKLIRILSGLENLAGVPGTVGGAVKGNAGAFGKTIGERVEYVRTFTNSGKSRILKKKDFKFSYRKSNIKGIIYEVGLKLKKALNTEIERRIKKVLEDRKEKQPWGSASSGSIFKNPKMGKSAGALIEEAGLKGYRIGDAMVSPKHANFIVNRGHAKASDVLRLMKIIQDKVKINSGICLNPEVVFVG